MDFSSLNKLSANTFNKQKAMIKNVLAGKPVKCPTCQQPVLLSSADEQLSLKCAKGCTDILLDKE